MVNLEEIKEKALSKKVGRVVQSIANALAIPIGGLLTLVPEPTAQGTGLLILTLQYLNSRAESNTGLKIFRDEILELIKDIDEADIKDAIANYLESEDYQLLVKRLVIDMYQTSDKIKITMFRNIIFNISIKEISDKEKLDLDYIISSIEQLSLIDMKILALFFNLDQTLEEIGKSKDSLMHGSGGCGEIILAAVGADETLVKMSLKKLHRLGFLSRDDWNIGGSPEINQVYNDYIHLKTRFLSELGKFAINYVLKSEKS